MVQAGFLDHHSFHPLDFEAFHSSIAAYSVLFFKDLCTQRLEIYVEILKQP